MVRMKRDVSWLALDIFENNRLETYYVNKFAPTKAMDSICHSELDSGWLQYPNARAYPGPSYRNRSTDRNRFTTYKYLDANANGYGNSQPNTAATY